MKKRILEIFGWYGTVVIICAYILLSFSVLNSNSILYQVLNLTGAIGIAIHSFYKKDYQPGVLNIIWTLIATIALIQIVFLNPIVSTPDG